MNSVNLSRWIDRLGFRRSDRPEYIYAVQPVTTVRDESSIVPPALGPEAIAGSQLTAAATRFGGLRFTNRGAGQALIRWGMNSPVSTGLVRKVTTASADAGTTVLTNFDMGDGTAQSIVETVDFVAAGTGVTLPVISTLYYTDEWWIGPGEILEVVQAIAASPGFYQARWIEFPPENQS